MRKKLLSFLLIFSLISTSMMIPASANQVSFVNATITVSEAQLQAATPLVNFKNMGVNFEMSKTSDEMWSSNGKWMEQTYAGSGIKMIRWGYDAWVFDWENELPLNTNYQGGMNTKDDAGTFGLREFLKFAKEYDIIPFLHLPIESWNHNNGKSDPTYARVLQLAENMATYLHNNGFETVYFDMGNEPMEAPSNPYGTFSPTTYGSIFKDFYTTIKNVNENYKIVMMANNTAWYNSVKAAASEGGKLYFDAIDYHNYPNTGVGWGPYYNRNDDDIFGSFGPVDPGVEKILGEANIPWPDFPMYSTSLGSGLALLNGFLKLAKNDDYSSIIMWPSQWPSNDTTYNSFNPSGQSFGWFDQDAWYDSKQTKRLNGPMIAEMIAQKATLSHVVENSSSDQKLRTFSFTNEDKSQLNVIVINKRKEDIQLTFDVPNAYNAVKASAFIGQKDYTGTANADLEPDFIGHIAADQVTSGSYTDYLSYGESALVYTFYIDDSQFAPAAFDTLLPENSATAVSTMQNFTWEAADGAENYRITISKNADLSNPIINTTTSGFTNYQPMIDLEFSTQYYWKVTAMNNTGETDATSGIRSFTTARDRHFYDDHDSSIQYSGSWQHQNYLGSFGRMDHGTGQPGATATITFTGTQAILYGIKDDWIRKISVKVNNGTPEIVDLYEDRGVMAYRVDDPAFYSRGSGETHAQKQERLNKLRPTQQVIYDTGKLSNDDQQHTIEITVLNDYNPNITSSWVGFELDYYEVIKAGETPLITSAMPPTITTDLASSIVVDKGQNAVLTVSASSPDNGYIEYEWYKDGKLLSETSNVLTLSNVDATDAGEYFVRFTNVNSNHLTKTVKGTTAALIVNGASEDPEPQTQTITIIENERQFNGTAATMLNASDKLSGLFSHNMTFNTEFKTPSAGFQSLFYIGEDTGSFNYAANNYFVLYMSGGNRIGVEAKGMDGGYIHFYVDLPQNYNDNNWHTLSLEMIEGESTVFVIDDVIYQPTFAANSVGMPNGQSTKFILDAIFSPEVLTLGGAQRATQIEWLYSGYMKNTSFITDAEEESSSEAYRSSDFRMFASVSANTLKNPGLVGDPAIMGDAQGFRIPSLLTAVTLDENDEDVILAFIDKGNDSADWGNIDIAQRRSLDNGKTWSAPIDTILSLPPRDAPQLFDDWGSAFFIDPLTAQATNGDIVLMVDMFPESKGLHAANWLENGTGYKNINGKDYLVLYDGDSKVGKGYMNNLGNEYTVREDGWIYDSNNQKLNYYIPQHHSGEYAYETMGDMYYAVGEPDYITTPPPYVPADPTGAPEGSNDIYVGNIYLSYNKPAFNPNQPVFVQKRLVGPNQSGSNYSKYVDYETDPAPLRVMTTSYLWVTRSSDFGETWSQPVDITPQVKIESDQAFLGVGPGTGLVLQYQTDKSKNGRILMPLYRYGSATAIYSDDNGYTWERSNTNGDTSINNIDEVQFIELYDGTIMSFGRQTGKGKTPVSYSYDGGETWSQQTTTDLISVRVQKSVITYPIDYGTEEDPRFSYPAGMEIGKQYVISSHATGNSPTDGSRTNGVVSLGEVQPDGTIVWFASRSLKLQPNPYANTNGFENFFAYSSLAVLENGNIGVLFEPQPNNYIAYAEFNLEWILSGD